MGSAAAASPGPLGWSSFSAWWFIATPQLGQIIGRASVSMAVLFQGDVLAPMAQRPRHPEELAEELVDARQEGLVA